MNLPRPAFFLVPGLFLLTLGMGNFVVGSLKLTQYQEITQELANVQRSGSGFHGTPLRRLLMANDTGYRLVQRKQFADARKDFYRLIKFGGKIFMALGIPFLTLGLLLSLNRSGSLEET